MQNRIKKYLKDFQEMKDRGEIPDDILKGNELEELHKAFEEGGMFELITTCFYAGYAAGKNS